MKKLKNKKIYEPVQKFCEPMLSKYNLYTKIGGETIPSQKLNKSELILWIIHLADGSKSNYEISNHLGIKLSVINSFTKKNGKN